MCEMKTEPPCCEMGVQMRVLLSLFILLWDYGSGQEGRELLLELHYNWLEDFLGFAQRLFLEPLGFGESMGCVLQQFYILSNSINPRTLVMPGGTTNESSQGMEKQFVNKE